MPLLCVDGLRTMFPGPGGEVAVVDGVSFTVEAGQTLGLVGESGSGKSLTCLSLVRLVPPPGWVAGGRVLLDGKDLRVLTEPAMRRIRGRRIAMMLQDPQTALNPAFTVGSQVAEAIALHHGLRGRPLRARVVEMLRQVGLADPERRADTYPHQLSGGMRQRVAGAIALACRPALLIADEPTTALDATVQAQFLRLLEELQVELGFGLILVTHDLGAIARLADRVAVMYAGRIVETGPVQAIFGRPAHPYTRALLRAIPRGSRRHGPLPVIPGQPPGVAARPAGCHFAPRCPDAVARCTEAYPPEVEVGPSHRAACWLAGQGGVGG
jgi:oligopeptide/dipeptide ABC transporter ATP-binding protein